MPSKKKEDNNKAVGNTIVYQPPHTVWFCATEGSFPQPASGLNRGQAASASLTRIDAKNEIGKEATQVYIYEPSKAKQSAASVQILTLWVVATQKRDTHTHTRRRVGGGRERTFPPEAKSLDPS